MLKAQRFIEQHSNSDIHFAPLAGQLQLHISEQQLNHRFYKASQCTLLQYLLKIRVNRACNLLEITQLPSNKIVYEIGYQDESDFRRLFKKHLGTTMEQYRRQFGSLQQTETLSSG